MRSPCSVAVCVCLCIKGKHAICSSQNFLFYIVSRLMPVSKYRLTDIAYIVSMDFICIVPTIWNNIGPGKTHWTVNQQRLKATELKDMGQDCGRTGTGKIKKAECDLSNGEFGIPCISH
jgi:hypothetical protein